MWKEELKIFKEIARKLFFQRLHWLFKQMRFFYPPPHNNNINPKIITPVFIYVEKGTEDVKLFRIYLLQSLDISSSSRRMQMIWWLRDVKMA